MPPYVLLANPENRRAAFFQAALRAAGAPPARVVSWLAFLRGEVDLGALLEPGTLLRIESPGEDAAVERELIARGAGIEDTEQPRAARIFANDARGLPEERGRILHPRQWYLGFRAALEEIAALGAESTSDPRDVACMFDKRACQTRLAEAGVPVPPALEGIQCWDDLRARLEAGPPRRVFVKLLCGSSASGVVALETRPGQMLAHTTVDLVRRGDETALFNSLAVRRYRDEASIAAIVDALLAEGARVEAWVPKAALGGRVFDLRVVAIEGRARHVVVRTSRSPLTNLHLGNARGDPARVQALLGERGWDEAMATVERAAAAFPRTRHMGIDLLVHTSLERFLVLEVNAFGDLLPNALHEGQDTYAAEVAGVGA